MPHTPSGPSSVIAKNSRACVKPWIDRIRFAAGLAASLSAIGLLAAVGLAPAESLKQMHVSPGLALDQVLTEPVVRQPLGVAPTVRQPLRVVRVVRLGGGT